MKRVGVIGGGQLAWMMADAAKKLGVELVVQTPSPNDPAVPISAKDNVFAAIDDANATAELAKKSDVITFENEFVDIEALSKLAEQGVCFRPRLEALAPLLDKYHQRCYLRDLGLPVPRFVAIEQDWNTTAEVIFASEIGFPAVLKARRHGYDGQGTFIIKDIESLKQKLEVYSTKELETQPNSFLLEEFIPFERELAVIAARYVSGEVCTFPVVETQQEEQVCRRAIAPACVSSQVAVEIDKIARTLLNSLDAVGVFGIEFFLTPDGKVLVNEVAPRTHNSGHFSIDACETSQFEQHLRAVCGMQLGNTTMICPGAVMVNLLGYEISESDYITKRQQIEQIPQAHVHWYGKTESRPGRKLGHVTVLLDTQSRDQAIVIALKIESIWYPHQAC
ncbi:5-(carboxyamino)imidazole ribonucleotide synthase [Brasilonema octagenarum]|uniref:N5-carboxyaminoimidazole ribonucleotide synthase n=1 Tax=Brasilonema octagenarum UFV-OR1 TaxID=417115 RepID=A0ABX1MD21_9CYAN|nr:5-(carboxyamino)imidazole ribonucleotide synthase [Brasilonema octagenarum]NMF64946.1 5-(carboxyamino)imidazole ribonucleotide synthase [Brasilonema octagenarum UFV-OR1]